MKTKTGKFFTRIAAIALSIAIACPYAYAADVGKVTYTDGRVDVVRQGSDLAMPLREGDAISVGDAVRTKSNSKAELTFVDNSVLRIAQNSRIQVKDYVLDSDNKRKTANIMLERGKARTIIAKMADKAEFCISTPNAIGTVKGSDVYASYQAGSSSMLVAEGQLSVLNPLYPKDLLVIPAGNSVTIPVDETPKGPRAYLELEKKMQEDDTSIPANVIRTKDATNLKGAFTKISGNVSVKSKGSEVSNKATTNNILGEGDTIETGNDGIAEISFDNGNGMSLKPNTKITITKLVQDPKTGQYENRFETSMGKVRARIEKLKETNSTFEIKTPTAICGARGTLMYVEIAPSGTRVFFEGGVGYLHSLISSLKSAVDAGQSSYADNSGNVSDPATLSEGEREDWGSGWDAGNGTEGYSEPDGTVGVYLEDGKIVGVTTVPATETQLQEFFNDPLFSTDETVPAGEEETLPTNYNFIANISGIDQTPGMEGNLFNANFPEDETMPIGSIGKIQDTGGTPFTWYTSQNGFYSNGEDNTRMTADGGAFYGVAGGIGYTLLTEGFIQGSGYAIYIDPDGEAGIASGDIFGTFSDEFSTYVLGGEFDSVYSAGNVGTSASQLYNSVVFSENLTVESLYGDFLEEYDIPVNTVLGSTQFISGQRWGTYSLYLSGENDFYRSEGGSRIWSAFMTGNGLFGSGNSLGTMKGDVYGIFDTIDGGSWNANSNGMWECRDNYIGEPANSGVYYGLFGGIRDEDVMIGKMVGIYAQPGDVELERSMLSLVYYMGSFYDADVDIDIDYLEGKSLGFYVPNQESEWSVWSIASGGTYSSALENKMSVFSIQLIGDSLSENDNPGGYWIGLESGLLNKDSERITGAVRGMTLSGGKVGLISGDLLGITSGSLNWEMVGLGQWEFMGTTGDDDPVDAKEFQRLIEIGSFTAGGLGSFRDGGAIDVTYMDAMTMNFYDQNWGIWSANLDGTYDTEISSIFKIDITGKTKSGDSYSNAYILITMDGTIKDDALAAEFNGIWLEAAEGGMVKGGITKGVADGYIDVEVNTGTWNAGAVGEWVEVENLGITAANIDQVVQNLGNMVNVPITVAYSNVLSGTTGGVNLNMNMHMYALSSTALNGLWLALINGSGTLTNGWNFTVQNANTQNPSVTDMINLTNGTLTGNNWTADVNGNVNGTTVTGSAAGTNIDNNIIGVGAGTYAPTPV